MRTSCESVVGSRFGSHPKNGRSDVMSLTCRSFDPPLALRPSAAQTTCRLPYDARSLLLPPHCPTKVALMCVHRWGGSRGRGYSHTGGSWVRCRNVFTCGTKRESARRAFFFFFNNPTCVAGGLGRTNHWTRGKVEVSTEWREARVCPQLSAQTCAAAVPRRAACGGAWRRRV